MLPYLIVRGKPRVRSGGRGPAGPQSSRFVVPCNSRMLVWPFVLALALGVGATPALGQTTEPPRPPRTPRPSGQPTGPGAQPGDRGPGATPRETAPRPAPQPLREPGEDQTGPAGPPGSRERILEPRPPLVTPGTGPVGPPGAANTPGTPGAPGAPAAPGQPPGAPGAPGTLTPAPESPIGTAIGGARPGYAGTAPRRTLALSLKEAVARGLRNNPDLAIDR